MTNKIEPYARPLPDGWTGGTPVTKYWAGALLHLYNVKRPCRSCGDEISIDVTKAALQGSKKNAGLLLRNCPKCRAVRKAGGPSSRGGGSRPHVDNPTPVITEPPSDELETLRMANHVMKEELSGVYEQLADLRERLSRYELGPAMEKISKNTFPWA